jgi:predicted MPP superfamily phosphohydrolase
MATNFYFDQMLPASDKEAHEKSNKKRQVEIFTSSGTHDLHLRIGNLNEEHQASGYSVQLTEEAARELLDGLNQAVEYLGFSYLS